MNYSSKYTDCLSYIDSYWNKVIFKPEQREINHNVIEIPHTFVTPNDKKFNFIYYWDSFFIFRGLMGTKREWVMRDMVNNFCFLLEKHGIIPNLNAPYAMGRSQPPFFSSMIFDVYNNLRVRKGIGATIQKTISYLYKPMSLNRWLKTMISMAQYEYDHVWTDIESKHHHQVKNYELNRYGDTDVGYAHSSELESGWDFTSRFYNRCDEFLPIDLNTYLYKYEHDFQRAAEILGDYKQAKKWQEKKKNRSEEINTLMWNDKEGFFFDYDYINKKQSEFLSLAGFIPLWAGLASPQQAEKMIDKLKVFETEHGLLISDKSSLAPQITFNQIPTAYQPAVLDVLDPKQWDYPHIWPPLEYLTVIGLLRYGYIDHACRIMRSSVKTHARLFRKYGTFFEKIDGVTGEKSKDFHYKLQAGFGWTNAVFYRYIQILAAIEKKSDIYHGQTEIPPFSFAIPH